jgi:anti-sigma regulatory factor (Ser/Thr protein kinase)
MKGVHRLVAQLPMPEMVTLMYLVFDPATRILRFTNAGHPPALVIEDGRSTYLEDGLSPPVGVTLEPRYEEVSHRLETGATVLLYTDGLVERRGVSIQDGLDRLSAEAAVTSTDDLDELCDHLLVTLLENHRIADDIALVAMRALPLFEGPLLLSLPAEPRMLVQMRGTLRRWLRESGVPSSEESDILVACGEACANVVQHAYGAARGPMELRARLDEGTLEISVRDQGEWRAAADRGGGWGLQLMRELMDAVEMDRDATGTEVRMRRRIGLPQGDPESRVL